MDGFNKFFQTRKKSYNMLKYIPGLAKIAYQKKVAFDRNKKKTCR